MLDELRDMLVERLLFYEKKNRALPARIIVYRDGVSEVSLPIFIGNAELSDKDLGSIRLCAPRRASTNH